MSVTIPYISDSSNSKTWKVTSNAPLDIRMVMALKSDLIDVTKFGGSDEESDYRYKGMIVAVVNDTAANNGIYICYGQPDDGDFNYDDSDYALWEKIGDITWPEGPTSATGEDYYLDWNDGNPQWKKIVTPTVPQSLSDLDDVNVTGASNGQILKYNNGQWVAADEAHGSGSGSEVSYTATVTASTPNAYEIGKLTIDGVDTTIYGKDTAGSGSGVTEQDIDYRLVFTPTGEGGLGYTERGANGTGLGYLTKAHFASNGTQGIIPAGTSYEDIFRAVLEGEEQLDVIVNTPKTASYSGSNIVFEILRVQAQPSNATIQYSASGSAPWSNTYNNDINGTDVGTYSGYFRVTKGNKFSTIKEARLVISKKSITVTPNTNKSSYSIGDTISYNAPTYGSGSPTATSDITYTIASGSILDTVGSITTSTSASSCTTLNASYPNYTFTAGSKSFTVNPVIQFKKSGTNSYSNYYTNYSQMNSDPDMSAYSNIDKNPNGAYMIPLVHRQGTGNEYKLKILGYKINKIYYWDTQNKTWKEDTGSFDYFGTPVQTQVSGLYEYEYTFSKSTNTDAALAISIKK